MKTRRQRLERREELKKELKKLPPERQRNIMKVVRILVAQKRLERELSDGTAKAN